MTRSLANIAEQLGVSLRTVQSWVAAGELRAISVSRLRNSRKPRLRVLDSDLQAFLAGRAVGGDPPKSRRLTKARPCKQYV